MVKPSKHLLIIANTIDGDEEATQGPGSKQMADPKIEHMRKMRQLEREQAEMVRKRDAELAAKEAAFERAKKEEAFQRQLQVEAARREVAATFKKNRRRS